MAQLSQVSLPDSDDSEKAARALDALRPAFSVKQADGVKLVAQYVSVGRSGQVPVGPQQAELPALAVQLLRDILAHLANGTAVRILPLHAKLTTQQAADLLNVSRPHLVKLLEQGKLKFERVGTHRRVLAAEVLKYQRERDGRERAAADELAAEAERLKLGY